MASGRISTTAGATIKRRIAHQRRKTQRWETFHPALFQSRFGGQAIYRHFVPPTPTAPQH
jgi:hypothetical protein